MPPPQKTPFSDRRHREFLYLREIDAIIAATAQTRHPIRNQALAMLLFCQALQPVELCWLLWRDLNLTENNPRLRLARNRSQPNPHQTQVLVNLQPLCPAEVKVLQQLQVQRTTEWLFASERQQRLSERSLHHLIHQAGKISQIPFPIHPYMLRRSGLYYRAARRHKATCHNPCSSCSGNSWTNLDMPEYK